MINKVALRKKRLTNTIRCVITIINKGEQLMETVKVRTSFFESGISPVVFDRQGNPTDRVLSVNIMMKPLIVLDTVFDPKHTGDYCNDLLIVGVRSNGYHQFTLKRGDVYSC